MNSRLQSMNLVSYRLLHPPSGRRDLNSRCPLPKRKCYLLHHVATTRGTQGESLLEPPEKLTVTFAVVVGGASRCGAEPG